MWDSDKEARAGTRALQCLDGLLAIAPMSIEAPTPPPQNQNVQVQLKYEDTTARYASHALLTPGNEELYLEFSSGVIVDRTAGGAVLPVHTRIAMTPAGVVRLWQLLGQAVQNFQVVQTGQQGQAPASSTPLPPLSSILPDEPIVPPDMQNAGSPN